jgi:hypothetical protein
LGLAAGFPGVVVADPALPGGELSDSDQGWWGY